jgi:hypothetical protein
MPFNVLGPDRAIKALRRDIERECATDSSIRWTIMDHRDEGSIIIGDTGDDISRSEHRLLLRLSKAHPEIAIIASLVDRESQTGEIVNADLLRYSRGRRTVVATFRSDKPDHRGQQCRLLAALHRYDENRKLIGP